MKFDRKDLAATLALLLIVIFCFFSLLFSQSFLSVDPLFQHQWKMRALFGQTLRNQLIPLWLPVAPWGAPLISQFSAAPFYPFNIFHIVLPVQAFFRFLILSHIYMSGVFTYLFARRFGCQMTASFLAAMAFMLGGPMLFHVSQLNVFTAAVWIPIVFLMFHFCIERHDFRLAALGGFLFAVQSAAGSLMVTLLTFILLIFWAFWFWRTEIFSKQTGNRIGFFFLVFLGFSMIQHLPLVQWLFLVEGGSTQWFAQRPSFEAFQSLLTLIFPCFEERAASNLFYIGILPIILIPFALMTHQRRIPTGFVFLAIANLAMFLIFREPIFSIFMGFFFCALCAFGLEQFLYFCFHEIRPGWSGGGVLKNFLNTYRIITIFIWLSLIVLAILKIFGNNTFSTEVLYHLFFVALGWLAVSWILNQKSHATSEGFFFSVLLISVLFLDLLHFQVKPIKYSPQFSMEMPGHFENVTYDWQFNWEPKGYRDPFQNTSKHLPRVVSQWEVFSAPDVNNQSLSIQPDWDQPPVMGLDAQTEEVQSEIPYQIQTRSADLQKDYFSITGARTGLLLLPRADYPGWKARLNGKPQSVHRAWGWMQAVQIPKGRFDLELEFLPGLHQWGKGITFATLVWLAVFFLHPFTFRKLLRSLSLQGLRRD